MIALLKRGSCISAMDHIAAALIQPGSDWHVIDRIVLTLDRRSA
jgi:hypothetical protein